MEAVRPKKTKTKTGGKSQVSKQSHLQLSFSFRLQVEGPLQHTSVYLEIEMKQEIYKTSDIIFFATIIVMYAL